MSACYLSRQCFIVRLSIKKIFSCLFILFASLPAPGAADNCTNERYPSAHHSSHTIQEIRILGNDFPALHGLIDAVSECNSTLKIEAELTQNYRDLQVPALQAKPAAFDVVLTGNNAIAPLLNNGLLRPLDTLVEKYATNLPARHKVRFNDQTMAIALLANSQHLFIRDDLLPDIKNNTSLTFDEVITLCRQLKTSKTVDYPLAAAFKSGWDLGLQFIEHYLAAGGEFSPVTRHNRGEKSPLLDVASGIKALERLELMSDCMDPDYLSHGSNEVQALWQSGQTAIAQLWGSRASSVLDSEDSLAVVREHTRLLGAPIATDSEQTSNGAVPVATLWWVGFAIPANISQADAEQAFVSMLKGAMSPYLLQEHSAQTVWLHEAYVATASAIGVQQVIKSGAGAYPSNPYIGLYHQAAGQLVADFLLGRRSHTETLEAIMAQVETSAFEKGLVAD